MMKYVFFVVGLLIYTQACSQTLSGDILDPLGQPVDVANIILFSLPDSNYVNGVVTYDGTFSIDITDPSSSLLQITALGFRDYWVEDLDVKKRIEVKMMAASVALKEAIVKAKIPQFQQKNGILNVNVENTNLSASGTAMDVLKRTPGLFLTRDENSVQMFGKGNVKIFLDGQEVQSIDIIKSLNSEEIVKIEVIRNPSAKYDAEGKGGVINIITKNSRLETN